MFFHSFLLILPRIHGQETADSMTAPCALAATTAVRLTHFSAPSWSFFKAENPIYWTRESTGTRESKRGESTSPKRWTPSSSTAPYSLCWNHVLPGVYQLDTLSVSVFHITRAKCPINHSGKRIH